jgi:hypothetical protein
MKNLLIIFLLLFLNCSKDKIPLDTEPAPEVGPNRYIRGKVLLDDQKIPSNCPVVFDKLFVGAFTDSLGNYEIFIPDSLVNLSGIFKVYYFLYDYDLDSLSIEIKNGNVVWGQEDVNNEGFLKTITLKQIISQVATSDKSQCIVGERIRFATTINNTSQRILQLHTIGYIVLGFYDIHTKNSSWRGSGGVADLSPHIDPGDYFYGTEDIKIKEIGEGYFFPVYSIDRGYKIPISITEFIWNSRFDYKNLVSSGFSFFVFIDDSKNLNFPLVNVTQN